MNMCVSLWLSLSHAERQALDTPLKQRDMHEPTPDAQTIPVPHLLCLPYFPSPLLFVHSCSFCSTATSAPPAG